MASSSLSMAKINELIHLFNNNPQILNSVQTGNMPAIKQILKSVGQKDTPQAVQDIQDLAGAFDTRAGQKAAAEQAYNENRARKLNEANNYTSIVNTILRQDPKAAAILAAVDATSKGVRAGGDIAANNANRLAQAILSGARTNSARQNEIYGPSLTEKTAEGWANERMRRGERMQRITKALADTIDTALGNYRADDAAARMRAMAPYDDLLGMPGTYWQAENQHAKRAFEASKGI